LSLFTIDEEKCERDWFCVNECPAKIIQIKDTESVPVQVDGAEDLCINCGHCVAVCPHDALSLKTMASEECPPVYPGLTPGAEEMEHFLRSRRSTRCFKDKPVGRDLIEKLIDVARYAPSGHNSQPVHWLVIQDKEEVNRLAGIVIEWMRLMIELQPAIAKEMHFDLVTAAWEDGVDRVLRAAPHLIVAHGLAEQRASQPACIIALTYLELAAVSHRLGACWAGYFGAAATFHQPMKEALALPDGHESYGAMMIGHGKHKYRRIPLRNQPGVEWR